VTLLLDNSAWVRISLGVLELNRAKQIADKFDEGSVAVALPFLLEAGYTARNADEHASMLDELLALPYLAIDEEVERAALQAQRQLVRVGHHRLATTDLLLAAIADRRGTGVLHYDSDYDLILELTDLHFESVWVAERGSL
jgi:predicted nucleic acid-binding protein